MEMTRLKCKEKCLSFLYFVNVLLAVEGFPPFGYFEVPVYLLETNMEKELNFSNRHFVPTWHLFQNSNVSVIQRGHQ